MIVESVFLLIEGTFMKAITAFRNYIKRRAEITLTRVNYQLGVDEELTISITYRIKSKQKDQEVDIFRKARKRAQDTYEEHLLSRTNNGDELR